MNIAEPNFLVIGAGRCGTSTVCGALSQHPQVFVSDPKEIGFFCNDELYAKGIKWYRRFFSNVKLEKAIGEGTVNYSKRHLFPITAKRIANDLPYVRVIYITRHPMEQIVSNWAYATKGGGESRSFLCAVRSDPGYLAVCDYSYQISAFMEWFCQSQILVLFLEDLVADYAVLMRRVFTFLGVDPKLGTPETALINAIETVRMRSILSRIAQQAPGFYRWRTFAPPLVRRVLARPWSNKPIVKPVWDAELLREILELVEMRAKRFLRNQGKAVDFWDFCSYHEIVDGP